MREAASVLKLQFKVKYYTILSTKFNFEKHALEVIKERGYRITNTRILVIRALGKTETPLSAYQVHELIVNQGHRIDPVSIYRILDFLYELDLVFKVGVEPGYFPRKLALEAEVSTFLLVDRSSKVVKEVQLPDQVASAVDQEVQKAGFQVEKLVVEVSASRKTG